MSRRHYGCVLCGYAISGFSTPTWKVPPWLSEFRAVWTYPPLGIYTSGIGTFDISVGTWTVPIDPDMRVLNPDIPFNDKAHITVMRSRPRRGIELNSHGYVFHDACFELLRETARGVWVDPCRLYRICKSLPFSYRGIGVCWGHDYGGLCEMDFENQHHYPWEDRVMRTYKESKVLENARYNPLLIQELDECISVHIDPEYQHKYLEWAGSSSRNCFSLLPWEIRVMIALCLPIKDVLSLVKSSKAFLPLLSDQTYWASVFDPGAECGFLFERSHLKRSPEIDWIAIYKKTMYTKDIFGMENRKRIWPLAKRIVKLLELHPPHENDDFFGDDHVRSDEIEDMAEAEEDEEDPGARRWKVAADIKSPTVINDEFEAGCRLLFDQTVTLPEDLVSIAFSVVADGYTEYLVGMRFISKDGSSIQLGYLNRHKELYYKVTSFQGFIVAMGSRGLHGLRILGTDGSISEWFGSPKDSPISERLMSVQSITKLEIGLDGYKIVYLKLGGVDQSDYDHQVAPWRESALWYPGVPAPNLFVNEASFIGEHPLTTSYQPLCYIDFGGPNGVYLRSLTEIRVFANIDILEIDFLYETNAAQPIQPQKLGRTERNFSPASAQIFFSPGAAQAFSSSASVQTFSIDGPGGEIIQHVEITTNRGRSVHFRPPRRSNDGTLSPLTPMAIEPGTTITGFYGSQLTLHGGVGNTTEEMTTNLVPTHQTSVLRVEP
uniref:Cryptochrome-1 n=1 Tax=Talaromyces marneffei PM1 TaxID=1077442 RepID=A0A093V7U8_TALMA